MSPICDTSWTRETLRKNKIIRSRSSSGSFPASPESGTASSSPEPPPASSSPPPFLSASSGTCKTTDATLKVATAEGGGGGGGDGRLTPSKRRKYNNFYVRFCGSCHSSSPHFYSFISLFVRSYFSSSSFMSDEGITWCSLPLNLSLLTSGGKAPAPPTSSNRLTPRTPSKHRAAPPPPPLPCSPLHAQRKETGHFAFRGFKLGQVRAEWGQSKDRLTR